MAEKWKKPQKAGENKKEGVEYSKTYGFVRFSTYYIQYAPNVPLHHFLHLSVCVASSHCVWDRSTLVRT